MNIRFDKAIWWSWSILANLRWQGIHSDRVAIEPTSFGGGANCNSLEWPSMRRASATSAIDTICDNSIQRRVNDLEERKALGIVKSPKSRGNTQIYPSGVETTQARIEDPFCTAKPEWVCQYFSVSNWYRNVAFEREKAKQDDSTSLLSNMLDQLKDMAVDMGQEIGRQNKALDHLDDDVTELGFRVKGANARARRLLGK
eukprot:Gb_30352 [translate_table: standard]